jgi:antitoxin YefM
MARTLPLSEAKARLSELVTEIERTDDELVITRNGRPAAVRVSADEFQSWRETHEIRRDPDLMRQIRRGLRQLKGGESFTFEEVFGEPLTASKRRR